MVVSSTLENYTISTFRVDDSPATLLVYKAKTKFQAREDHSRKLEVLVGFLGFCVLSLYFGIAPGVCLVLSVLFTDGHTKVGCPVRACSERYWLYEK
jgi:hypothetical protein